MPLLLARAAAWRGRHAVGGRLDRIPCGILVVKPGDLSEKLPF